MDVKQLGQFTQFSDQKLAKHNLFTTERFFLDVYCLAPGQSQRPHAHGRSDKVYVVLEGMCRFRIGSEVKEHGPGTAVLAPATVEHGVENAGDSNARLLVMMTPPPSDS
jgi:mannose-6-phosphate isomerase-like protein (cupin superfamily)